MTTSTNRLAQETSPYLIQHARNPVDWYPWGPEALGLAKEQDKPILLSIGYAACHWCHVMERESFEDPQIAEVMNQNFVCIKVDREERPDIDAIYMDAVQAMTGHGGWPMTMFLAPDGTPFYGGTYFPPDDRHGLPSFRRVLEGVADAWRNRREEIVSEGEKLVAQLARYSNPGVSSDPLVADVIPSAARQISGSYDPQYGGFGVAPKFPQASVLEFMLRAAARGDEDAGAQVEHTLTKMALGGIYDQVGGGFARYSVDPYWLVPHFEKMLYDNAQLLSVYTHAFQLFGRPLFKRIALETAAYLLREMRDQEGGFHSSEDADSEGVEGKYYVWSYEEFMSVAPDSAAYFGVTPQGNFEGANILTAAGEDPPPEEARKALYEHRANRIKPGRDDKILMSWNALALGALAEASAVFEATDLLEAATGAAEFLSSRLVDSSGRLLHTYRDGKAHILGMLEDYAYLADGLLTLWEASGERRWLDLSLKTADQMLDLFSDGQEGALYTTGSDHEQLIIRQKEIVESATPSSNGVAALVLQRLGIVTGNPEFTRRGVSIIRSANPYFSRAAQAVATSLAALDFYSSTPKEIVLTGISQEAGYVVLERAVWSRFIPNKVVVHAAAAPDLPICEGKPADVLSAYVCENYACKAPVRSGEELEKLLG